MQQAKILFVCRANVGRSQSAMMFYNKRFSGMSHSAGTQVDIPGQMLADRRSADIVVAVMAEKGLDMSRNIRRQLTPDMLNFYELIVVLAQPEAIPEYLQNHPKAIFRHIQDTLDQPVEVVRRICNELEVLVRYL